MGSPQDPWSGSTLTTGFMQNKTQVTFGYLVDMIEQLTLTAKSKIARIRSQKSAMSIGDMFDLQMAMNKLSQFSEMSTSVISAMNTAMNSVARKVSG